jgi:transcriptional regulator with GAF, ATPase, and Fis domain
VLCSNPFHHGAILPDTQGELFCSDACLKLYRWFLTQILPFFDAINYCDLPKRKAVVDVNVNLNLEDLEKQAIVDALEATNNVQNEAAKLLGISARKLNFKMKKLKMRPIDNSQPIGVC